MSVHGLPSSTEIKKLVHKKLLYAKFPKELCGERRKQFDDDIGRIVVTNEISPVSVNIKEGEQVKSIFVLQLGDRYQVKVQLKHGKAFWYMLKT